MPTEPIGLLAITPGDHERGRDLAPWLAALASAGLRHVTLREPHLDRASLARLVDTAASLGLVAWVHDRNPHARGLGHPLHLPAAGPAADGPFGRSCHTARALDQAFADGASWAVLSPVWRPRSKPDDRPTLGLDTFCDLAGPRPVLALGGVDGPRLRALQGRGYGGAVCGALFGAASPAEAARILTRWHPH